jgi:hypothetical protein
MEYPYHHMNAGRKLCYSYFRKVLGKMDERGKEVAPIFTRQIVYLRRILAYDNTSISGQKLADMLTIVKEPIWHKPCPERPEITRFVSVTPQKQWALLPLNCQADKDLLQGKRAYGETIQ